jgi:MFS family permease
MSADANHRLGFITLAPGVTPRHTGCYLFAALVSIGLFTYITTLTPFVMEVNLGLPKESQGRVSGLLQFWQEIVLLAVIGWWGALSDRVGRRTVYIAAFLLLALAYTLYPLATSVPELLAYRLVFGIGVAAAAAMLATVLADYPLESSRGKLTGLSFFLNGIGSVVFFVGLTRLPSVYAAAGASEIQAGRYAYFTVAGIALFAAAVMFGLKPGRPVEVKERKPLRTLAAEGLRAGRNPRILLAYAGGFASRADMSLITLFLGLWAAQAAMAHGATAAEAAQALGMTIGVAQGAAMLWAPFFGYLGDRIPRVVLMAIGFALAAVGYGWIGMLEEAIGVQAIPALIALGIGQASVILASTVILGQEAPPELRGSVFGVQSFCGGLGILVISWLGGELFDRVGPQAPFIVMCVANAIVMAWSIALIRPAVAKSTGSTA